MLIIAGVITLIIMVVGVVGNCLTVVALIRNAKIRTVAAAFIASLCISDLLFCFLVVPFAASQFFHGTWIHGDVLCSMIPLLRYGSVGVSLLSIVIISINRYILIAWPSLYPSIFTKTKVTLYIIGIWTFSYSLQIPTLLGIWGKFGLDEKLGTCSITEDENGRTPKTMLFVCGFALPCIIIIISYATIYWVVRQSHKRMAEHTTSTNYKRSEMHITKMVLVIFICFVVCYLPIALVKILDKDVRHPPIHVICYILLYLASCVNPVVYVTMNKQYRQAYLNTIRCNFINNIDSYNTQPQNSKTHLSVNYFKNMVIKSPKV
ncbi:hypothetical protein WA026_006369 [Henosepilachna vigintioctopunctata]|uniref:G-protein coupled receptors family 1 profile domain-containing protein n=1 Tax=Henosepilachna vigintioctopunctata TaxID=420089 RepID=A0AAW1TI90_9CUCU